MIGAWKSVSYPFCHRGVIFSGDSPLESGGEFYLLREIHMCRVKGYQGFIKI